MNEKTPHISVAPMMDWTDRHCRYFHRLLAPSVRLYTEMVTTAAILHGDKHRLLDFNAEEHPVALQLGGSEAADLSACAKIGEDYGYDEINLNCGCPSPRVQKGRFGACLMAEPDTVAEGVAAMRATTTIPITVKCRIGIDERDDYAFLAGFIETVSGAGCDTFIIHARKAWLHGLSPKENREIPPLNFERVQAIKAAYPHLNIILNGGIGTVADMLSMLSPTPSVSSLRKQGPGSHNEPDSCLRRNDTKLDGIMIGRRAYQDPWFLTAIEREIFGNTNTPSREDVALKMIEYIRKAQENGTPVKSVTRHILGLFHAQPGGKRWRQILSTKPYEDGARPDVLNDALKAMAA